MSHFAEIELKMQGDAEAIVRALCDMEDVYGNKQFCRSQIEVHEERQNLFGYQGDMRAQKAHLIIRRQNVGSASNDLGFEKKADGSWAFHVSNYDSSRYNADWQKRLLSKWGVQKVGLEAERSGNQWRVEYKTEGTEQFAYVHITR